MEATGGTEEVQPEEVVFEPPPPEFKAPPPPPPPRKQKVYVTIAPVGLKLVLLVIGFVTVNIGATGVFQAKNYIKYNEYRIETGYYFTHHYELNKTGYCKFVKEGYTANLDHFNVIVELHKKPPKPFSVRYTDEQIKSYRFYLEAQAEEYRLKCNGVIAAWVAVEYYFVIAAIICVVAEVASLVMGLAYEDFAKKFRLWDGAFHGFLGILILAGSICLMVGLHERMDGRSENGPIGIDEGLHAVWDAVADISNEYDRNIKNIEKWFVLSRDKTGKENATEQAKLWYSSQKAILSKGLKAVKDEVSYDEKVTAATLGFISSALYIFTAPMIGRGVTNIPLK